MKSTLGVNWSMSHSLARDSVEVTQERFGVDRFVNFCVFKMERKA